MTVTTRVKLSTMMFLEFFIWGAWFVTMGTYLTKTLSATGVQNGNAYATQSWGAIIAPFIIGLIADRFFSAQKVLGILHLTGAALLYYGPSFFLASAYPLRCLILLNLEIIFTAEGVRYKITISQNNSSERLYSILK